MIYKNKGINMWKNLIKKIFNILMDIIFYGDNQYFKWLAKKDTEPLFVEKDENETRFSEKTYDEEEQEKWESKKK